MSKIDKITSFDPNGAGDTSGGIFGLPFTVEEADIVILPVPWDVTVSYGAGTSNGPQAILDASPQLDLYDEDLGSIWKNGIAMLPISEELKGHSEALRQKALPLIRMQEIGIDPKRDYDAAPVLKMINEGCASMVDWVETQASKLIEGGKKIGLLGGDHSTPLGLLKALGKRHPGFGILQIDAHMDLREAYEGFTYSHASIMYNALQVPGMGKLVQVGVRDMCEEEIQRADSLKGRVRHFSGRKLKQQAIQGKSWAATCKEIIDELPKQVYISFDIDGLEPWLCPNTGTPVPGGLGYEETLYLLDQVRLSGREIIAFDLVEVNPGSGQDEWDGNVGARILYRMCGMLAASQKG